jgi:pSer/pThr/pTyr-binding forkhead associated (FHA) protein
MAKVTVLFGSNVEAEYNLEKDEHRIGRSMECDIVVDNLGISRHHCSIVRENGKWILVDGGSNNGTFLGGKKVDRQPLKDNDRIVLGKHSLVFDANGSANPAKSPKKAGGAMGGEMTMFVDQAALAKALTADGKRMVLTFKQGGREVLVQLLREETTIGTGGDLPVRGFLVKPVQAKVVRTKTGHRIESLGGWRGVTVNGAKLSGSRDLRLNDSVVIAGTVITYKQA